MTEIQHRLMAILFSLGPTEEDVAATLTREGVKGSQRSACDCPLARRLQGETGWRVVVAGGGAWVESWKEGARGTFIEGTDVFMPDACACFESTFDAGGYPDLVAK